MSDLKKIVERLDGLGKNLFNRYGSDIYTYRCILHDIKADILKIDVTHSSLQFKEKEETDFEIWKEQYRDCKCNEVYYYEGNEYNLNEMSLTYKELND